MKPTYKTADEKLIEARLQVLALMSKQGDSLQRGLLEDCQRLLQLASIKIRDASSRQQYLKETSRNDKARVLDTSDFCGDIRAMVSEPSGNQREGVRRIGGR